MNMSSSPVLLLVLRFYALFFCFNVALTAEVDITTGNDLMSFVTVSVVNMRCCFFFFFFPEDVSGRRKCRIFSLLILMDNYSVRISKPRGMK